MNLRSLSSIIPPLILPLFTYQDCQSQTLLYVRADFGQWIIPAVSRSDDSEDSSASSSLSKSGEAGTEYSAISGIPKTSFTCDGKVDKGFYANVDTGCQVFHLCIISNSDLMIKSFRCPNETIFNQQTLTCHWVYEVDCASSSQFFNLNNKTVRNVPAAASSLSGSEAKALGESTSAISSTSVAQPQQISSQQPSLSIFAVALSQPEH